MQNCLWKAFWFAFQFNHASIIFMGWKVRQESCDGNEKYASKRLMRRSAGRQCKLRAFCGNVESTAVLNYIDDWATWL